MSDEPPCRGPVAGRLSKSLEELKRWIEDGKGTLLEKEFARANEIRAQIA